MKLKLRSARSLGTIFPNLVQCGFVIDENRQTVKRTKYVFCLHICKYVKTHKKYYGLSCLRVRLSACSFYLTIDPIWNKFIGVVLWIRYSSIFSLILKYILSAWLHGTTNFTVLLLKDSPPVFDFLFFLPFKYFFAGSLTEMQDAYRLCSANQI